MHYGEIRITEQVCIYIYNYIYILYIYSKRTSTFGNNYARHDRQAMHMKLISLYFEKPCIISNARVYIK